MIERQVDVVERVSDFMSNGRSQAANHGGFLSLVQLCFQLASAAQLRRHFIERFGQRPDLIAPFRRRHADTEITAGNSARGD